MKQASVTEVLVRGALLSYCSRFADSSLDFGVPITEPHKIGDLEFLSRLIY